MEKSLSVKAIHNDEKSPIVGGTKIYILETISSAQLTSPSKLVVKK